PGRSRCPPAGRRRGEREGRTSGRSAFRQGAHDDRSGGRYVDRSQSESWGSIQIALAAMLTVKARSAALNRKGSAPWAATVRRICLLVTPPSETCQVMPMTAEK